MRFEQKEDLLLCVRNELVPENPKVDKEGVLGLLTYRCNSNKRHPDSVLTNKNTCWIAQKLYNKCIPESQDTIFNCWNLIKIYDVIYRHNNKGETKTRDASAIKKSIENNEVVILSEHQKLFDDLADMQHCIANFMPAPSHFNGWKNKYGSGPGKGEYWRDNDFPDIYYLRAKKEFKDKYEWINEHMEEYSLQFFTEFNTGWEDGKANGQALVKCGESIENVVKVASAMKDAIEKRAERLLSKMLPIKDNR